MAMDHGDVVESTKSLLLQLSQALTSEADDTSVSVMPAATEGTVHFVVLTKRQQVGKLIGRQGRTARSIRILVDAIGNEVGLSFSVELGEIKNDNKKAVESN